MVHRSALASFALRLALLLLPASAAIAEEVTVRPTGELAKVDMAPIQASMERLLRGSAEDRDAEVARIKAAPQGAAPPALMALSRALFLRGEKDDAAFWFYAGQLRARFDADRCADSTAGSAVSVLNQAFGPEINKHTFQDPVALEALIGRVLAWDRATPHEYEHRWIALHGMNAMMSGLARGGGDRGPVSLPADRWDAIAEQTRRDYLEGFREALLRSRLEKDPTASPYTVTDGVVTFHGARGPEKVKEADAATFQALARPWARDKRRVYRWATAIEGADPASFTPIDGLVGRDANAIWTKSGRCSGCDAATFRRLDTDLYADRGGAFVLEDGIGQMRVDGADPATLRRLSDFYLKDSEHAFSLWREIPGADGATFEAGGAELCRFCARDKNRCYWNGEPVPCPAMSPGTSQPGLPTRLRPGQALVNASEGLELKAQEPAVGLAHDWLALPAGEVKVTFTCDRGKAAGSFQPASGLQPGSVVLLVRRPGDGCEAQEEAVGMVRGRADGPAIWFYPEPGSERPRRFTVRDAPASPRLQATFAPGPRSLAVRCREVTRTEVIERTAQVTLDLSAGEILDLEPEVPFRAPEYRCVVKAVSRTARDRGLTPPRAPGH